MPRYTAEQALEHEVQKTQAAVLAAVKAKAGAASLVVKAQAALNRAIALEADARERRLRATNSLRILRGEQPENDEKEEMPTDDDGNGDEPVGSPPAANTIMAEAVEAATATTPREKQRALRHIAAALADEPVKDGSSD